VATVKCDVCGGIFSPRHLASHKRLAHTKNLASGAAPLTQKEIIQKIALLYDSLSLQGRQRVVRLLTAKDKDLQKDQKIE